MSGAHWSIKLKIIERRRRENRGVGAGGLVGGWGEEGRGGKGRERGC